MDIVLDSQGPDAASTSRSRAIDDALLAHRVALTALVDSWTRLQLSEQRRLLDFALHSFKRYCFLSRP